MRSRSIQAALSRWFAAQALAGLSLVCVAIYAVTAWSFEFKQANEFERQAELVRHLIEESGGASSDDTLRHKLDDFFSTHAEIKLVLRRGEELVYASPPRASPAQWRWMRTLTLRAPGADAGTMQLTLGLDVQEDARLLRRLAWTLVGAVALGTLLIAWTGALLVRRGLAPLQTLARQTAETGPAHPGRRIDPAPYACEIRPRVTQFNAVLDSAEQAYQQLEAFNADVAHELRTPLANLIGTVEVELARPRTAEALREALVSALEEARRVSTIVLDMLFLSKADRGAVARRSVPVSLAQQVRAVLEFHEALLEDAGLRVQRGRCAGRDRRRPGAPRAVEPAEQRGSLRHTRLDHRGDDRHPARRRVAHRGEPRTDPRARGDAAALRALLPCRAIAHRIVGAPRPRPRDRRGHRAHARRTRPRDLARGRHGDRVLDRAGRGLSPGRAARPHFGVPPCTGTLCGWASRASARSSATRCGRLVLRTPEPAPSAELPSLIRTTPACRAFFFASAASWGRVSVRGIASADRLWAWAPATSIVAAARVNSIFFIGNPFTEWTKKPSDPPRVNRASADRNPL